MIVCVGARWPFRVHFRISLSAVRPSLLQACSESSPAAPPLRTHQASSMLYAILSFAPAWSVAASRPLMVMPYVPSVQLNMCTPATETDSNVTPAAERKTELYDPLEAASQASRIEQIHAEADAFFDKLDADGSNTVDVNELRAHLTSTGYKLSAVDAIFPLLDADASGEVDRDELRAAFVKFDDPSMRLALGLGTSEADSAFERLDVNRDGAVSQDELTAYLTSNGYPNPEATAQTIFQTLDVNGDGSVSREELRQGYVKYSALRQALGLPANAAKNPKGAPKRLGRGRK